MKKKVTTAIAITDPLVKYQSLVSTGACTPDLAQHRLAHHLQQLYLRLRDYSPAPEQRRRLQQIAQAISTKTQDAHGQRNAASHLAVDRHPIWRNPLISRFLPKPESKDSLALAKVLTSHQAALEISSPKGLFLSGEVGTGKSMLLDLLAEGLPSYRKKKWHFTAFMLHVLSRLEQFRQKRQQLDTLEQQYSLLWIASEMVEDSPILFLDEFQLPDRAASKIVSTLFTVFFQLGGVLVASSNRMPEELEKATGNLHVPPVTGGLIEQVLGRSNRRTPGNLLARTSDFASFLELLKARCDFWHMEGAQDYRRRDLVPPLSPLAGSQVGQGVSSLSEMQRDHEIDPMSNEAGPTDEGMRKPALYFVPTEDENAWIKALHTVLGTTGLTEHAWCPTEFIVFGRIVAVHKQKDGVACWDFDALTQTFGPADYITLASNFHTFIIDKVPILTLSMKNEARRFITLLDALYEARCKLVVRAAAGPDDLFFPDTRRQVRHTQDSSGAVKDEHGDATYSETIAEVFQDQTSPFRPNISTYSDIPDPDQDSGLGAEPTRKIDFGNVGAFTGEDERFAYKRAVSRLWELCSTQWHARTGEWWQPLSAEARHWEGSTPSSPLSKETPKPMPSEITLGPSTKLEEPAGLERFKIRHFKERQQ